MVTDSGEEIVQNDILLKVVEAISTSIQKLAYSGLNERALILLISDSSKISKAHVRTVLANIYTLNQNYGFKPVPPKTK